MALAELIERPMRPVLVAELPAHEGPVYAADEDALYVTSVPQGRETGRPHVAILRIQLDGLHFPRDAGSVTVVREEANAANGMTLGLDGRLVVCEQGTLETPARISAVDRATGLAETLVEPDLPLNSPNDVVVRSDGTVWFTDPAYGHRQGFRPPPVRPDAVHRFDPRDGTLTMVADGFDKPNGLAFSPDERILYVSDNGAPHELLAFDVSPDGVLGERRLVAVGSPGHPDGLKVGPAGQIHVSSARGVELLSPSGAHLAGIELPGAVTFASGGRAGDALFITADSAVWAAVPESTKGA